MTRPARGPLEATPFEHIDPSPWLERLAGRFGIPPEVFAGLVFYRLHAKYLYVAAPGLTPPAHPPADGLGMRFMRIYGRYPKMTTAAAMCWGGHAVRNVVEAGRGQAVAYVTHRPFTFAPPDGHDVTPGQVLVRHQGLTLGVGLVRTRAPDTVESMFPKRWAGVDLVAGGLAAAATEAGNGR